MIRITHIIKATGVAAGAEKHLISLLPALDRRKFNITVVALTEPRSPVPELVSRLLSLGVPTQNLVILSDADPTLVPRLAYCIRKLQPSLVHTHLVHADLYGAIAARLAGVPMVISSRHNDDPFRRSGLVSRLVRLANRQLDHFLVISDHLRAFTVNVEGVPRDQVTTVRYGMQSSDMDVVPDIRRIFHLGSGLVVACVARLMPQKGHRVLLAAFRSVVRIYPDAQLLLLGDGPLRTELEQLTRNLRLEKNVCFAGWRTDASELLYGADIFVLPSLWEGFGLVLLEAMAAALPIVAAHVGPIPEIVLHDKTGLLVQADTEDALARAILRLLASPEERSRFGREGRYRLGTEFSMDRMLAATEDVYSRLFSNRSELRSGIGEAAGAAGAESGT